MLVILGLACSTSMSDLVYQLSFLFAILIEVTKSSKRLILWNIIDAFRFEVKKKLTLMSQDLALLIFCTEMNFDYCKRSGIELCLLVASRLYLNGVSVNPLALYPPVDLPVSSSTPMLSSLVCWDHSSSWEVPTADDFFALGSGGSGNSLAASVEVNVSAPDSEDAYLTGHVIDGRVLFPATGYLVLAWRQLARMSGQTYQQTPVSFDDVHIHRATILPPTGKCEIIVITRDFRASSFLPVFC